MAWLKYGLRLIKKVKVRQGFGRREGVGASAGVELRAGMAALALLKTFLGRAEGAKQAAAASDREVEPDEVVPRLPKGLVFLSPSPWESFCRKARRLRRRPRGRWPTRSWSRARPAATPKIELFFGNRPGEREPRRHRPLGDGHVRKGFGKIVDDKVVVTVAEGNLVINHVAFEGGNKLRHDQLELEVQSKDHSVFNEATAKGDVERLKEAYRKVGHDVAKVSYRLVNLPNGRVDLVFTIDEGDKTEVKEIRFAGNNSIAGWRLKNLMQTTEMNFLSFIKTSDVYIPATLATDEEAIRKYYMHAGYADFRIVNTDAAFQPDQGGYIITITVDEGPLYHVSSVKVTSHINAVDSATLERFVGSARRRHL